VRSRSTRGWGPGCWPGTSAGRCGAAGAAATPSARLVLVLAAVHAARTGAIRAAQLDDAGLGNRRLIIAGRVRPIGEFTPSSGPGGHPTHPPVPLNPRVKIIH
jgi:hypothetical protein